MKTIPLFQLTFLILVSSLLLFACESQETKIKTPISNQSVDNTFNYAPTILPSDTTKLWMSEGSIEQDTVLILGDGGPKNQLDYEYNGQIAMAFLPNFKNYYNVNLHQAPTYNRDIFNWQKEFTLEMAETETANSSEMLHRAIAYFKEKDKYVVVVGHSYSAFIIHHYLANYTSMADKYIITSGRLKSDSLQTVYQLKDINTIFEEGGKAILIPDESRPPNPNRPRQYFKIRTAKNLLKAAIGQHDYTELLKDKDLSNVSFLYGTEDINVGLPTKFELDFFESKGAQVFGVKADHYTIWRHVIDSVKAGTIKL